MTSWTYRPMITSLTHSTHNFKSFYMTKSGIVSASEVLNSTLNNLFCAPLFASSIKANKMPVIMAVAAHRRHHSTSCQYGNVACTGSLRSGVVYAPHQHQYQHYQKQQPRFLNTRSTSLPEYSTNGNAIIATTTSEHLVQPLTSMFRRFYAKGKDKPKSNKTAVVINESELREVINYESMKIQFDKTIEQMQDEFSKQLNIRGASGALETLTVEFEGETYPLQELAQVGRKNPQLAVLNLASLPDALQPVLKAIQESGMNLNPQQEGTTIYVPLPKVTREHRENLAKNAKVLFNKFKGMLQAIQNKHVKQCKSQKDIGEDLSFRVQQQIMKIAESYIMEAEKLLNTKQSELLDSNK